MENPKRIETVSLEPLRVLHVLYMCEHGGIESWLLNLLRLGRNDVQFDICVLHRGSLDKDFVAAGAVIRKVPPGDPAYFRCPKELRNIIVDGKYDVVHFHLVDFSGHVLKIAADCGVPVRIAHSHTTSWEKNRWINLFKRSYQRFVNIPLLKKHATHLVACSHSAGQTMFGKIWNKVPSQVVYCGIDLGQYKQAFDRQRRLELCRKYGIPEDAIVVGTMGRLSFPKNHEFLLRLFDELSRRCSKYVLFIGGEGKLRTDLERQIKELSLQDRVFLPGACRNVPEIVCQLFDVFCLPSRFEGFAITLVEALAGGLATVCSDVITREILDCAPERFFPRSLSAPVSDWCDALEEGLRRKQTPQEGVELAAQTPFSIENSMESLLAVYRDRSKFSRSCSSVTVTVENTTNTE